MSTVLSIGEVLWDLFPDAQHLGGAPFNFAASCARLGHQAFLLTAVGQDELGRRTLEGIRSSRVSTELVQRTSEAGTGTVLVEFDSHHEPHYTIRRPAAYDFLHLDERSIREIARCRPDFLCFGTLNQLYKNNRDVIGILVAELPDALRFYDVNLRKDSFNLDLLRELMSLAQIIKLNESETEVVQTLFGKTVTTLENFCRTYSEQFGWRSVWVTRGAEGCSIFQDGKFVEAGGFSVASPHPVGAGDAFSAAVCHGISQGWPPERIGEFANRVGAIVASRPGAVSDWTIEDCYALTCSHEPSASHNDTVNDGRARF